MTTGLTRGGGQCATCGDEIDRRATYCREHIQSQSDPDTVASIAQLAQDYQAQRAKLALSRDRLSVALQEARSAGMGLRRLENATGLRASTLQRLLSG